MTVHNYITALSYLQRGRFKREWWRNSRPLANNTYLEVLDGPEAQEIGVRFHRTYVVRYHADGSTTIDTGGWWTTTTLDRINGFAHFSRVVFRNKNKLYYGDAIDHTPVKTVKCSECHGAYQTPEKQALAILSGWQPSFTHLAWNSTTHHLDKTPESVPTCACNLTGYVKRGGNPIYREWDGGPLTFGPDGEIIA